MKRYFRFYYRHHRDIDLLLVAALSMLAGVSLPFIINLLEKPWR